MCWWPVALLAVQQVSSNLCHRSAAEGRVDTLSQKAIYTVKVLLKMGENVARNMYSKLKRTNKKRKSSFNHADHSFTI